METNQPQETPKMELSKETLGHLNETRKWTNFLAIIGFVFIVFIIFLAFFMSSVFSSMEHETDFPISGTLIGFIYLAMGLIYFFPILYLYKFSTFAKKALFTQNSTDLNEAFKNLKSHYRFMGILTIIMFSVYALIFIVGMVLGLSGMKI